MSYLDTMFANANQAAQQRLAAIVDIAITTNSIPGIPALPVENAISVSQGELDNFVMRHISPILHVPSSPATWSGNAPLQFYSNENQQFSGAAIQGNVVNVIIEQALFGGYTVMLQFPWQRIGFLAIIDPSTNIIYGAAPPTFVSISLANFTAREIPH